MSIIAPLIEDPAAGEENAAILSDLTRDPRREIILPDGRYPLGASAILRYSKPRVRAGGKTTIYATGNFTAMFLGRSGERIQGAHFEGFELDGAGYDVAGFQFTNGGDTTIRYVTVRNMGRNGAAFHQHPAVTLDHVQVLRAGARGNSGSHSILLDDAPDSRVEQCEVFQGLAMGLATDGNCSDLHVTGGRFSTDMDPAGVGLEAIGIRTGSNRVHVTGVTIRNSQDNGISASGDFGLYADNTVDGALNSCVAVQGDYNRIMRNTLMNGCRETPRKTAYPAIMFTGSANASHNLAQANLVMNTDVDSKMEFAARESEFGTAKRHGDYNQVCNTMTDLPMRLVGEHSRAVGTILLGLA